MNNGHRLALILVTVATTVFLGAVIINAQQMPDPRVADIVHSGKLRVALGLGTPALAMKNPTSGELRGPALELGRTLAARMGVELQAVEYPRPRAILEGLRTNEWDVTFFVIDPVRAAEGVFSIPYMKTDFSYLVRNTSEIRTVADMDQVGMRIAVARGDASDLQLSKLLKRAELVRTDTLPGAVELVRNGQVDAYSSARTVLLRTRPECRVCVFWTTVLHPSLTRRSCPRAILVVLLMSTNSSKRP